jgi:hypothetical protein
VGHAHGVVLDPSNGYAVSLQSPHKDVGCAIAGAEKARAFTQGPPAIGEFLRVSAGI